MVRNKVLLYINQKGAAHFALIALMLMVGIGIFLGAQLTQQNQSLRSEASTETSNTQTAADSAVSTEFMWPVLKIISNECDASTPLVIIGWTHYNSSANYVVNRDDEPVMTLNYPDLQYRDMDVQNNTVYSYWIKAQGSPHGEAQSNKITIRTKECSNP